MFLEKAVAALRIRLSDLRARPPEKRFGLGQDFTNLRRRHHIGETKH